MLTYFRYALATLCFAASVGCLALWLSSNSIHAAFVGSKSTVEVVFDCGIATASVYATPPQRYHGLWRFNIGEGSQKHWLADDLEQRQFGRFVDMILFPTRYPALIFALAGVASLRLGRLFTLRSAIIATTVVARLPGMAVGL